MSALLPEVSPSAQALHRLLGARIIVMLGPSLEAKGGMAAVARNWAEAGFFARWRIHYIPTYREAGTSVKLLVALAAFWRLAGLLIIRRAALVHVHAASRMSFWRKAPLIALAQLGRVPVIVHIHGGNFAEFYTRDCSSMQRWWIRKLTGRSDRVLALSEYWREQFSAFCEPRRITVAPNFVVAPPEEPGVERNLFQILFLGQISAAKGLRELLQALSLLRREFPALRLVCAGTGDFGQARRWAAEFGVADAAELVGWVGPQQKWQLLRASGLFVLPSHAEAMPVALLEAMAMGAPSVATRVGSVPEVLQDEVNGLLVEPRDVQGLVHACRRLLSQPEWALRLGGEARSRVARLYSPQRCLRLLDELYREILCAQSR